MEKHPQNIIQKIWNAHAVKTDPALPTVFAIDLMLMHEVTSAQAFDELRRRDLKPFDVNRLLATLDHSIPTRKNRLEIFDDAARIQVETLRRNAAEFGVPLYDFESGNQGIVHVIGPELGATKPGMTIVCGDSHTSTHGAFGALAFGVGTSEVGHVLATGCLLLYPPKTCKVDFSGVFRPGVFAKDAILKLIQSIGIGGANGHIIEYAGSAVSAMSMEERMTMCNMSIECGARAGLVAPDETTFTYIKGRKFAPSEAQWEGEVIKWRLLCSDHDASYDKTERVDVGILTPMVTWGTNPEQGMEIGGTIPLIKDLSATHQGAATRALEYIGLKEGQPIAGTKVDWAFLGSCTNGRIEDLRIAAKILDGKKVHSGTTFFIVPGSEQVLAEAQKEGLVEIFESAGAQVRMPGCSMCLGMNDDKVPAGARCISSSNRNFVGRQGAGSRTHLASPATVASSAVTGCITSPEEFL